MQKIYSMKMSNSVILKLVHIVFWIIFIGLCIETGATLLSFLVSLFKNPEAVKNLYMGLDLSAVFEANKNYYIYIFLFIISILILKTCMAYLVIKIFLVIDMSNPFSFEIAALISAISRVALGAGIISIIAEGSADWMTKRGVPVAYTWSGGEFLFLAGIIFFIAQIFERGVLLQSENDLTV